MRAGHGGAAHIAVLVAGIGAYDAQAGGADVHPVPVVGEGGTRSVAGDCAYIHALRIASGGAVRLAVVAGGKEHNAARHRSHLVAALHTGVAVEVIHGILECRLVIACIGLHVEVVIGLCRILVVIALGVLVVMSPTVVGDNGTVVCAPYHSGFKIAISGIILEHLARHQLYSGKALCCVSTRDSSHALAVVAHCGDGAANVGTVGTGHYLIAAGSGHKVLAAVRASGQEIGLDVLVGGVDARIHNRHNYVGVSNGVLLPDGDHVYIGPLGAVVLIVPLLGKQGVVEIRRGLSLAVNRIHVGNTRHRQHAFRGFGLGDGGVERNPVPAVKTKSTVLRLVLRVNGEDSLTRNNSQVRQDTVKCRGLGFDGTAQKILLD